MDADFSTRTLSTSRTATVVDLLHLTANILFFLTMADIKSEKTWKVKVFRRESYGGWHQQVLEAEYVAASQPNAGASSAHRINSVTNATDTLPSKPKPAKRRSAAENRRRKQFLKKKCETMLDTAPRKGSIVFPKVRQRYSVSDNDNDADKSLVIRRNDAILFVSRRRTRAMMLQFQSLEDCVSFTDHFLLLNDQQQYINDDRQNNLDVGSSNCEAGSSKNGGIGSLDMVADQDLRHQRQKEDGAAYLVQLIHDETFLRTVGRLEQILRSSSEGRQMLEGAANRNLTSFLA